MIRRLIGRLMRRGPRPWGLTVFVPADDGPVQVREHLGLWLGRVVAEFSPGPEGFEAARALVEGRGRRS